jgi:hypothetical protein
MAESLTMLRQTKAHGEDQHTNKYPSNGSFHPLIQKRVNKVGSRLRDAFRSLFAQFIF